MNKKNKLRKNVRGIFNYYSSSRMFKFALALMIFVTTIIFLPLILIAVPLVFAWEVAGIILENSFVDYEELEFIDFDSSSKWGEFSYNFANWKNLGEQQW